MTGTTNPSKSLRKVTLLMSIKRHKMYGCSSCSLVNQTWCKGAETIAVALTGWLGSAKKPTYNASLSAPGCLKAQALQVLCSALNVNMLAHMLSHLRVSSCHTVAAFRLEPIEWQSQPNTRNLQA